MIKVLHVIDKLSVDGSNIHGPARQLSYRIPHYDPSRLQARVCNLRHEDRAAALLRDCGVPVTSLGRGKFDPRTLLDLRNMVREWRPTILHAHGYASWDFARLVSRWTGVPLVVQEHFVDEKVPLYQRLADRTLHGCDERGLAVSEAVRRFMIEQRYTTMPIEVIWNGVPDRLEYHRDDTDLASLRRELGIPQDAKVVGLVGRLADMKGHRYFLEGAAAVAAQGSGVRFLIVGEGPLRHSLEEQARRLELDKHVIFAGYRTDAVRCLAMCDVAVVASIYGEGFCSVGLEAHAAQTPLITTDLPAFDGLYVDGENARVVRAANAAAIGRAVIEILDDPRLGRQMSRRRPAAAGRMPDEPHCRALRGFL
jgi:glycosyltransferase involved in cell wall biosynthesis